MRGADLGNYKWLQPGQIMGGTNGWHKPENWVILRKKKMKKTESGKEEHGGYLAIY